VRLEHRHLGDDVLQVVHEHALSEFQFQTLWIGSRAPQRAQHILHKIRAEQLPRADVHRHGQMFRPLPGGP